MAATAQSSFFSSAAVFAGGLAVGVGGAIALSRSSFAPSPKLNKSTKDKARRSFPPPSSTKEEVSTPPASEILDASDVKGAGPVSDRFAANKDSSLTGVTGQRYTPEAFNKISDLDTRFDLSRVVAASGDQVANANVAAAPVWLTGLPSSLQLSTSTGLIDKTAYQSSTAVFVYESTTNGGFGSFSEKEAQEADAKGWFTGRPRVFSMQTRTGAGAAIAGYLAQKGTTSSGTSLSSTKKIVSALTNADGFLTMAPSIASISPQADSRLVLQVSCASQEYDEISNDYAAVLSAASSLANTDESFTVVLSADRVEAAEIAAACYAPGVKGNVAHIFDGAFAGREAAKINAPLPVNPVDAEKGQYRTVVEALNAAGYTNFAYEGAASPTTLIVVPNGSHFSAARAVFAKAKASIQENLGIISVRVVRPWTDEEFLNLIPDSVDCIHVLDEVRVTGMAGVLYEDVQASVMSTLATGPTATVQPISLRAGETLTAAQWYNLFEAATSTATKWQLDLDSIKSAPQVVPRLTDGSTIKLATFIDLDSSVTSQTATLAARTFRERNSDIQTTRILSRFDNFEGGGMVRSDVAFSSPAAADAAARVPLFLAAQAGETHTLVIGDAPSALKGYNIFASLSNGGTVLINSPGWDGLELAAKLKAEDRRTLAEKNARIYLIDASAIVESIHDKTAKAKGGKDKVGSDVPKETAAVVLLAAFLRHHLNASSAATRSLLSKVLGTAPLGSEGISGLVDAVERGVHLASFSTEAWKKSEPSSEAEANSADRPTSFRYNGFSSSADAASVGLEPAPVRATWAQPAWEAMFSEAYQLNRASLRPDLDEENRVLTVTENRRLTPVDYDRNVFHMELSTAGTGLQYQVGEALGIHGWNDADEVIPTRSSAFQVWAILHDTKAAPSTRSCSNVWTSLESHLRDSTRCLQSWPRMLMKQNGCDL
jgi:sulfite reductase (NADPH) flavoprotein alpha-component